MPVDHFADAATDLPFDERVLLDRIAARDRNALRGLYHRYYHRLASFLWRSIGRTDGVDGIINDAFIELWRGAPHSEEALTIVSTWVFSIVYRKARDHLSRQSSPATWHSAHQRRHQFVDPTDDSEIGDMLWQWLGTLTFEQRSTLTLIYQVGCSLEEIAAITSVPIESVRARIHGVREKLRCAMPDGKKRVPRFRLLPKESAQPSRS
jgi:RNA polymerase sigma-70 factor (ECF subfamily)